MDMKIILIYIYIYIYVDVDEYTIHKQIVST
jgi:hypothetical protein